MAKINIVFNDINYSIDESSFATASAELQRHLSTTMSGSGSVINFGGISYNIDSTKLSSAASDLVSHLGTISGSSSKVTIGGTEYGIDFGKLSGAVADIEAVLGSLNSGDNDNNYGEVVFAEQTISGFSFDSDYGAYLYDSEPSLFGIVSGDNYIVLWDGVEYACTAYTSTSGPFETVSLGNTIAHNGVDSGEPFFIVYINIEQENLSATSIIAFNDNDSHTIGVYKEASSTPPHQ